MFGGIYNNRRVLITGTTGFKGSWLALWLKRLGAIIHGLALPMPGELNHSELLDVKFPSLMADIRNREEVKNLLSSFQPEIIFHLAAQPLVRESYLDPVGTFDTNIMGTLNLLDACRDLDSLRAVVVITSDKCYENREDGRRYREDDPMGGYDPYSASKGCAEIAVSSFRRSFFNPGLYGKEHHTLIATARAGNVIGGGDWAKDRLVPDLMRGAAAGEETLIRNPRSLRPWQHVLEPLSGYLLLGQRLFEGRGEFACGWNFGPGKEMEVTVEDIILLMQKHWDMVRYRVEEDKNILHEAALLSLDCTRARDILKWESVWSAEETCRNTAVWYRDFYTQKKINTICDLENYIAAAEKKDLEWSR